MGVFDFIKKDEINQIELLNKEVSRLKEDIENLKTRYKPYEYLLNIENEIHCKQVEKDRLSNDYKESLSIYKRLKDDIFIYQNNLEFVEYGVYEPVYDYDTSEEYKDELESLRYDVKDAIRCDRAANCDVLWTVNGSTQKGKSTTEKRKKLMIRAFNGECDAIIAKVKWNNIVQMRERLMKSFESINRLGTIDQTHIREYYRDLRMKELNLEYEYQQKKYEEKEREREIREQLREEEKAIKEYEKVIIDADKDEKSYRNAIDRALIDIEEKSNIEKEKLRNYILELEIKLQEAHERKERAISMAQQTRCGHVYVISNIGSFGEDIYKIGLTRRLEPIERINELGNASVPFKFDIHSIIFSEDAPTLEQSLHKIFENKRVNLVNQRKEYFHVTLDEIEVAVKKIDSTAEFFKLPEAREYRESLSIKNKQSWHNNHPNINPSDDFPDYI